MKLYWHCHWLILLMWTLKKRVWPKIAKTEAEIKKLSGKLNNQGFLDKAPEAVIEENRSRLAEEEARLEKVDGSCPSPAIGVTEMSKFDKSKLPSRHVSVGPERAPHRSYYYAMGMTEEEINQPFVGVVSCWNEAAPCNIALMRQAQAAKAGVKAGEGTPREILYNLGDRWHCHGA